MQRGKNVYFNVSRAVNVSSRSRLEILTSRLGLVSAGKANVSVSSRSREVSVSVWTELNWTDLFSEKNTGCTGQEKCH